MKPILAVFACAGLALFAISAQAQERPVQTFKSSAGPIKITPVYHASLEIEAGGKVIVVDPAKPAVFTGLPQADLILLTDIHGDHMDPSLIAAESKPGTEIIAPPAVVKTVTTASPLSNGEKKTWGGWTIEAIPMYNLTRGPEAGISAAVSIHCCDRTANPLSATARPGLRPAEWMSERTAALWAESASSRRISTSNRRSRGGSSAMSASMPASTRRSTSFK